MYICTPTLTWYTVYAAYTLCPTKNDLRTPQEKLTVNGLETHPSVKNPVKCMPSCTLLKF